MKILTDEEGLATLRSWRCPAFDKLVHQLESGKSFARSPDAGHLSALAREVSSRCHLPALLWIHEIGIWPSSENEPLVKLLRRAVDEHRDLADAPVHLFEEDEKDKLQAFLGMALQNMYGSCLVERQCCRSWLFSHDEWTAVTSPDSALHAEALALLSR